MNRTGNDLRAATRWSAGKTALWVFAAHVAVLGLCIGGIYTQPDTVPAGQCEGIGWGCTTSPRAEAFLALIFFGVPALTVSLVVCLATLAIVAAVRDRRREARAPRMSRSGTSDGPGSDAQRAVSGGSDGRGHDGPE